MQENRIDEASQEEKVQPSEAVEDDDLARGGPPGKKQDISHSLSPQSTKPIASTAQSFIDHALHFLSHASNETLGSCFAGLGIATYLVLGRVGLLVIGIIAGVILHATWEGIRSDDRDEETKKAEQERRQESSIEVVRRVLEWRSSRTATEDQTEKSKLSCDPTLDYSGFGPETSAALGTFTDSIIQNYVHWWYDPVIPAEASFPASCRQTFVAFVLSLSGHLNRKRSADVFLDFVANASSIVIVFLGELSSALNASPNMSAEQAISEYLKLKPESSLSYMLDVDSQKSKLSGAAEDILHFYLDPKAYNCKPVHNFLKQVLAQTVLGSTVVSCSRPEWINEWIVYGLEESETTKEVMEIVDAGVQGSSKASVSNDELGTSESTVRSVKEATISGKPVAEHRRQMSRAEEAMDEAMREARRLTELMIAEDERIAKEHEGKGLVEATRTSAEDASEKTSLGAPTPTSSQSELDKLDTGQAAVREHDTRDDMDSPRARNAEDSSPIAQQFTSFDQIIPRAQPTALMNDDVDRPKQPLTLRNATVSIFDDSVPGEKSSIKAKPNIDYLIQVEPATSAYPGWMISRKYADFETLHEVLRRISVITGAGFTESHAELPRWKSHTKASLRLELEKYICAAVRYQPLAESEGMKRFLERDRGLNKTPNGSNKGFGWPTPDAFGKLGGEMMGALTKAPKQVAGGGKAVIGGVAGLVVGNKRQSQSQVSLTGSSPITASDETFASGHKPQLSVAQSLINEANSQPASRTSQDSHRDSSQTIPEHHGSTDALVLESKPRLSASPLRPRSIAGSEDITEPDSTPPASKAQPPAQKLMLEETITLPPPPSEMPPDYISPTSPGRKSTETTQSSRSARIDQRLKELSESDAVPPPTPPRPKPSSASTPAKPKESLTDHETSIAIELIFAVISQLYTLSSAWQFRRTLLAAAKRYLLRPGNLQLLSIRDLLQTSLLDSNLSDQGVAHHVHKLRANALPTDEEMEIWKRDYPEKTEEQKEELRIKARKLLITRGMPQALTSVMGAAASGEALGKVFDCLQMPEVSRGLIHGLILQGLRVVTN